jgi:hypothetical protein
MLSDEPSRRRAVKLATRTTEHLRCRRHLIRKQVADRNHVHRRVGLHGLQCRAGPAAAAPHEADTKPLLAGGEQPAAWQRTGSGTGRNQGLAEK